MSKEKKYYKDPRYGNCYGYIVATPPGKLIWPSLVEPAEGYEYEGQQVEGKYEATILLDANSKKTKEFMDEIKQQAEVMQEMYNEPTKSAGKKGKKKKVTLDIDFDQIFTHSEDADWVDIEQYPYYKDKIILKAAFKTQPVIRGAKVEELEGGMTVQFGVNPLITSNGGVTFQLKIVKFVEDDGQRFGGGGFNVSKVADEIFGEELDEATSDETEEEETYEEAADEAIGKGKKLKKKVVEEDEDEEEDEDTDTEDDSETDSEDAENSGDLDDVVSEDEESEDDDDSDESEDEEEEEEEEEPKPVKKAAALPPVKRVTAEEIKKKAAANKDKLKREMQAKSGKRSAIDRF